LHFSNGNGITGSFDAPSGTLSLTGSSSKANYQAALTSVAFSSAGGASGDRTVSFQVEDGSAQSNDSNVVGRKVTVNLAPVASNDSKTVDEDDPATNIDVLANDSNPDGGPKKIAAVGGDANTHGNVAITNNGDDLTYTPAADYCNAGVPNDADPDATFTYTLNGGSQATVSVEVNCVNDAPVIDLDDTAGGNDSTVTFIESNPHDPNAAVQLAENATLSDVDDDNIDSATITITDRPDGDGFESLSADTTGTGIIATYTPSTGVLLLENSRAKSEYLQVLKSVRYDNTKSPPDTTDRTVTFALNDGSADSNTATTTVHVVPLP
jgi:VCBS repeat-containing protein